MPELSRRHALAVTAALAAAAGARTVAAPPASATEQPRHHDHHGFPEPFDEVYQGRRIQGRPASGSGHHHGMDMSYEVFVDGAELHVMQNADGTWISVVSHYDPVMSPRAAARAAVDELQGAKLVPFPAN
ncbi:tyrosinase cofactor [Streptomyces sp. NPDC046197]|uniref:apotyrosinase chaperone MelC1 n=1 Tax=Streptomyces sp. NPDC046197 TaxID=3154337 RepID=UPI003400F649